MNQWQASKALARVILFDRVLRRRIMGWMLAVVIGLLTIGVWLINDWLMANPLWFLLWWGGCAMLAVITVIFALYDMGAVVREEKLKMLRELQELDRKVREEDEKD